MIIRILIEINFNMAHLATLMTSLMVFILVMQGNVSRSIPEGAINMTDFECRTDSDCLEMNTYCDISLNLCSQCLNCNIYFRTPKKNIKCPKDISDCSVCLDGYFEEIFFGGEVRDICVAIDTNNILPTPAKISSNSYWQNLGFFFIFINVCLVSVLWTYIYRRVWITNSSEVNNTIENEVKNNKPPSYNSCMRLDNFVTDDIQEFHLFTGEQPPRNEWRSQNAVPFSLQDDFEDMTMDENENENAEDVDETDTREIDNPEFHDEETMASVWSPLPLPLPLPLPPPPPLPTLSVTIHPPNNSIETCSSPPFKRFKRLQRQPDQDEDNLSDMSQDE